MQMKRVKVTDTQAPVKTLVGKQVKRRVVINPATGQPSQAVRHQLRRAKNMAIRKEAIQGHAPSAYNPESITAISRAIEMLTQGVSLPMAAYDTKRVQQVLQGVGKVAKGRVHGTPRLARLEAENLALWMRRLISADLLAQGYTIPEIAQHWGIANRIVRSDLRELSHFKVLAATAEEAQTSILSTLNRLETLQRQAFNDLTAMGADQYISRRELRQEIEARELRTFDLMKNLGLFVNAGLPKPDDKKEMKDGVHVDVHIGDNILQPKPPDFYKNLSTEELQAHMEQYVANLRHRQLTQGATDAAYKDVKG